MHNSLTRVLSIMMPVSFCLAASISILHSIAPSLATYQLIFATAGLFLALVISRIDIERISFSPLLWYWIAVIPLALTEMFGAVSRGSTRWIDIFGFRLQTSEVAKISLIIFVASWLSQHDVSKSNDTIRFFLLMSVPTLLIFIQPDLGSALMIAGISMIAVIAAGIPFKQLGILLLIGCCLVPIGYFGLQSYQKSRIESFIFPQRDPLGSGYNSLQSTIAVGSGKMSGRGLGQGTQSHLRFLPERHTDFIFASFVEELGLVGGLIIITSYIWLNIGLIQTAKNAIAPTSSLIALVSAGHLTIQALVNMGMNMGILPITGITLPFVSYGGSSLLSSLIIIGLNISIALHARAAHSKLEIR